MWRILPDLMGRINMNFVPGPLHLALSKRKTNQISGIARPGSKGVARKNHEAHFISWTGRANQNAECRLRNAE